MNDINTKQQKELLICMGYGFPWRLGLLFYFIIRLAQIAGGGWEGEAWGGNARTEMEWLRSVEALCS